MRLQKYIDNQQFMNTVNWEKLKKILDKDCQQYIHELKNAKYLLLRGVKGSNIPLFIETKKIRKNRKPRLIMKDLHDRLGKDSKKIYGWNIRKEGLFTTKSREDASVWGKPVIIFPIGSFKYVWSDDVLDLYDAYDHWDFVLDNDKDYENEILPELKKYHTNNLNKYLRTPIVLTSECIINGNKYYAINYIWYETLLKYYAG